MPYPYNKQNRFHQDPSCLHLSLRACVGARVCKTSVVVNVCVYARVRSFLKFCLEFIMQMWDFLFISAYI